MTTCTVIVNDIFVTIRFSRNSEAFASEFLENVSNVEIFNATLEYELSWKDILRTHFLNFGNNFMKKSRKSHGRNYTIAHVWPPINAEVHTFGPQSMLRFLAEMTQLQEYVFNDKVEILI